MVITKLTNQKFCYWLQGYFEIALRPCLHEEQLHKIIQQLDKIDEPLGLFTSWLKNLTEVLKENNYCQNMTDYFAPLIIKELNHVFQHDIDNSYNSPHSADYLQKIHRGEIS